MLTQELVVVAGRSREPFSGQRVPHFACHK
jgi:hypothetical protein